jgi:hypothetical protein
VSRLYGHEAYSHIHNQHAVFTGVLIFYFVIFNSLFYFSIRPYSVKTVNLITLNPNTCNHNLLSSDIVDSQYFSIHIRERFCKSCSQYIIASVQFLNPYIVILYQSKKHLLLDYYGYKYSTESLTG